MIRTNRTALLAATVAAALPAVARAVPVNHYYVGPSNSSFSSAANWSLSPNGPGGSPPAANDNAIVSPSTTKAVMLDATPGNVPLGTLSLTPSGTASVTLYQTAASVSVAALLFGPRATYNQVGGNTTATGALTIDATASAYNLSSSGVLTAAGLTLGATAAGTFTQSAGTASFTAVGNGTLRVGGLGPGLLSLTGGTLADTSAVLDSYLSASLVQSGGTHTVSLPGLLLGQNASYSLSAGSLNVAGPLTIGGKGTYPTGSPAITADAGATFTQFGGTVTLSGTSPLVIDSNPGSSARYSLSAGSILLPGHPDITIGSSRTGTFAQSGGTVDNTFNNGTTHSTTYLAKNAGSSAAFSLSDSGQFATAAINVACASSASASITQTGGTLTCYWAALAQAPGSSASYNISAGTFAPSSSFYGGDSGSAYITQTGGTVGPTGTTAFGRNSGSFASYSLSGTGSLKGFETSVGAAGFATFTQSGGTHSAGFLAIAFLPSSSATYSLSAGSLTATSMSIGPSGGLGTLAQSGGTVTLTNTTASSFLNLGSAGALKLSGGTLSAASTRDAILNGRVTHSGGALSLPNANLRLGTTGTAAAYSLSNTAALTAKTLTIGESAPATFTQTGGTATVTALTISATGRYSLSGGALLLDYATTSPASQIRSYLAAGLLAATASVPSTSRIAYIESAQLPVSRWSTPTWSIPDNTTLLVTLTLTGDANLDGKLNADDYALIDRGYAKHLSSWSDGDFNYDGQVTSADYLLIDSTRASLGPLSPEFLSLRESQFGADYVAQLPTSVPEPSSAACLLAGWVSLAGRRRRVEK